jgi:hypothetical protein
MKCGVAGAIAMAVSAFAATQLWGIAGTAAGTMLGALVLLTFTSRAARGVPPEAMGKR